MVGVFVILMAIFGVVVVKNKDYGVVDISVTILGYYILFIRHFNINNKITLGFLLYMVNTNWCIAQILAYF